MKRKRKLNKFESNKGRKAERTEVVLKNNIIRFKNKIDNNLLSIDSEVSWFVRLLQPLELMFMF